MRRPAVTKNAALYELEHARKHLEAWIAGESEVAHNTRIQAAYDRIVRALAILRDDD
jgi:hypothetical protein